jgi:hypothetical protein
MYNDGVGSFAGHVRIYTGGGSSWVQRGADIDGEAAHDQSGSSLSLSADGQTVAIGAYMHQNHAGHVRIYTGGGSSWVQRGADIDSASSPHVYDPSGDALGSSVSLSADGQTVAIGAPGNGQDGRGSNAGYVRIYTWGGSSWVQRGGDIDGEAAVDHSGASVSLSADGQTVAVGAWGNGETGIHAGHVRIFTWGASSWVQAGADIDGEAAGDWSGYAVSLSADGQTVAVGAGFNDGAGSTAGHVRAYSLE